MQKNRFFLSGTALLAGIAILITGCGGGVKPAAEWTAAETETAASTTESDMEKEFVKEERILETEIETEAETETEADEEVPWNLILVNRWTPLPEEHEITLKQLGNGQSIDERCYPDLQEMLEDCKAEGLSPVICSSYRTFEKQESLYTNRIESYVNQGYNREEAQKKAGTSVAVPGTSEHQLGLALDIVDASNQLLNEDQENTPTQKWLVENSWKYGFILRYPTDKSDITGIIYEPWHYRYVGKEAAASIHELGICLEEYLQL